MNLLPALGATLALVALTVWAGWLWQSRAGRVRRSAVTPSDLPRLLALAGPTVSGAGGPAVGAPPAPGERATLVQLSSDLCSSCGPTRRVLSQFAADHPGVVHAEISLTDHPELAGELRLLSTPTTIIFDGAGHERGRIVGAPRKAELPETLTDLLEADDVVTA